MRLVWLLIIGLAGGLAGYLMTRFEGDPPQIRTSEHSEYISGERGQVFEIDDEGTGLESVRIWLEAAGKTHELKEEVYKGNLFRGAELSIQRRLEVTVDPKALQLSDGAVTLHAEARDFSWRGNVTRVSTPLIVDTKPPRLSLATGLTYVTRGGAEMVVYSIAEQANRHGVALGDRFFPGYPHPTLPERFVALYAYAPETRPGVTPQVVAEDAAGNTARVNASIQVVEKGFASDTISLSDDFMQRKVAEILGASNGSTLESYLKINRDLRADNAEKLREICQQSNSEPLWRGAFAQLPNSATSREKGYGVQRTYIHAGREVDRQTHLGLDLASTQHAEVPAANDGIVAFSDELGIYGKTVLLDHGIGLFSLYAHLSEIGVSKGDVVARGDALGRTGTTGLAGGDHLHFSMLVAGVFVDPLEWLDERWIREHIEPKLSSPDPDENADPAP